MKRIFYRPEDGVAADFIPFWKNGEFRLFYLKDYRNVEAKGEGTPWFQISTKDFLHYREHGEMIPRGTIAEQDLYVYTGSVIEANGMFHIFYTGHNPHFASQGKPKQAVMHAVSSDLNTWSKVAEDTLYANPDKFEPDDFRDPFVFWDEDSKKYCMLLTVREKNSGYTSGATAIYSSENLKSWTYERIFWAPNLYHTHECPDLFK